jgi:hypothetical protein
VTKKLSLSLAFVILLLAVSPVAKSDSVTIPVEEILYIVPFQTNTGQPFAAPVFITSDEVEFIGVGSPGEPGQKFDIGYEGLSGDSVGAFGNPNATILAWNGSDTLHGCAWGAGGLCPTATVDFGNGVSGSGKLLYNPRFAYVAIDSLTIPAGTPEPSILLLLGLGLGFLLLVRGKISVCP